MVGSKKIGLDAVNVGGFDLSAGKEFIKNLENELKIPFLSANLTDSEGNLLFTPFRIIDKNNFKIGIVGITNHIPNHLKDISKKPYKTTGNRIIQDLKNKVDYIVLLANLNRQTSKTVGSDFPDADYIFISRNTQKTRPTTKQMKNGPFVYGSGRQSKYLSIIEIRIKDEDHPLVDISIADEKLASINNRLEKLQNKDPGKSLEDLYQDKPNVLKLIKDYREQITKYEAIHSVAINTTKYKSVSLSRTVGEDPELLSFVDETLARCSALRKNPIKSAKNLLQPLKIPIKKKLNIN